MKNPSKLVQIVIALVVSACHIFVSLILDYKWEDWTGEARPEERSYKWWIYSVCCAMVTTTYCMANFSFLYFSSWDAERKIGLMRLISTSLEPNFLMKCPKAFTLPTINFLD